ncbi:MAG: PKD domain-containing protein [Candidatus Bipolaricaulota bacterium]
MKRTIFLFLGLLLLVAPGLRAAETLTVGVEQSSRSVWQDFATAFEQAYGSVVSIQTLAENAIPQQVVLQAFTRNVRYQFATLAESWSSSLARYTQDLSGEAALLAEAGAELVTSGSRTVGVRLPSMPGWFLAVLSWPQDRDLAVEFLIAAAAGTSGGAATSSSPGASATGLTKSKMDRSQHSTKVDGALGALLATASAALNTMSSAVGASLPSSILAAAAAVADTFGVPFTSASGTVTVVVEPTPGRSSSSTVAALSALGVSGSAVDASTSLVKVTVPLGQLSTLVSQLSGVSFFRPPYEPYPLATPSEGVAAIGATAYHTAGTRGAGVKVAVIDLGFGGLAQAQARGDLPATVGQIDYTGTGVTSGITHGTAVAEILYDVAPDASLTLIKIADEVDLDQAVTYCLANGIDIVNHSLGWYNTNAYDGTGTICDIARRATSGGILWVNAAGNEAQTHWEGVFADANSDGWHDLTLSFSATAGSPIILYLTWNEWPASSTDFDLYLYDPIGTLVASSTKYQTGTEEPTESIQTTATSSGAYTIRFRGAGSRSLELYNLYQNLSPAVATSSLLAPADVSEVVAVGAVNFATYATGPQQPYSSQGPTNDGRAKPDLVCPDNVATGTAPYTAFQGTSGAAPHAAGAAALLLSRQPSLSGSALRSLLLTNVVAMGSPNIYGQGRLSLQALPPPNLPPSVSFAVSPVSPTAGQTAAFNGTTSSDSDGVIVSYAWTFGDGGAASGPVTSHAYATPGSYTVTLTVTDNGGASASASQIVNVTAPTNQAPVASFTTSASSTQPGVSVSMNSSGSYDPDGTIVARSWSFGDGATASGTTTAHAYATAGSYTVTLTVTDNGGASASASQIVNVTAPTNQAPVASFTTSASSTQPGVSVSMNSSGSYDPDGTIVASSWSFGDGATASGTTTSHAYAVPGSYTVTLTVWDDRGASASATKVIAVQTPSLADLTVASFTASPSSPLLGQSVTFSIVVANQGSMSAGSFRIRLAGASLSTTTTVTSLAAGSTRSASLVLPLTAASETFTVAVDDLSQVAESNEGNNQQTLLLVASTPSPVAEAGGPYSGTVGSPISFSALASSGAITSYSWTFGDGGTAVGATPTRAYSGAGTYVATLTVVGPGGQSTDTAVVTVSPAQPALTVDITLPKSTYTVGEAVVMTLTVNRSASVYVCEVTPDQRVVLLFPNLYEQNNALAAGSRLVPGTAYTLRASEPTGSETLYAFAATGPVPGFPTSFGLGFPVLSTYPTSFLNSVLATLQGSFPSGSWSYDSVPLTIAPATPTTGTLRVLSSPTGATVRLDGTSLGTTNLERSGVTPGLHTVEISRSGYQTETRQVTIVAGTTTTVQVTLTAVPTNQAPTASFTFSPTTVHAGTVVQFDGQASSDPDGSIASYAWSFGDGGTGSGALTSHAYAATGTYTVQLTVTDNGGRTASTSKTLSVTLSDEVGWVSPVAFEDPADTWEGEIYIYDNDTNQKGYCRVDKGQWSPYLFLAWPTGGVVSNRVRLMVSDSSPATTHYFTWSVEAEVDGVWLGAILVKPDAESRWFEVAFTQGTLTRLRLRARNDTGGMWRAWLHEVDARDLSVAP